MKQDRRTFLRTAGIGCASVLVAGCSESSSEDGETESTDTDEESTETEAETETETEDEGTEEEGTEEEEEGPQVGDGPEIITMEAGGIDIWNTTDQGHFYFEFTSGDFDARVRVAEVTNSHQHAKGGIMVRESMEVNAAHAMVRRRPPGYTTLQWRPEKAADARSLTSDDGQDFREYEEGSSDWEWLRLVREGETIRGFASADGEDWTLLAELPPGEVNLSDQIFLGLAGTSHNQTELTTITFRDLEGIEPTDNSDIGNPVESGSVTITQPAVASTLEPDASTNDATLRGNLEALGGNEEVDVRFEYREATATEWTETETQTLDAPGEFSADVSELTERRYYHFRAIVDDGEAVNESQAALFATASSAGGGTSEGPESAAFHDPDDGFADMAPWLDDDTPIVTVSEPTREALVRALQINGPRVVVFETSGTIDLDGQSVAIPYDKCWVAGQTAPSPGITLIKGQLSIDANDCVVQHLRGRPGPAGYTQSDEWQPNAFITDDNTKNNVIDHCSGSWGIDETISVGYYSENTTITNCLIAEPLHDSVHPKGVHPYGTLVGNQAKNVTIAGNVYTQTLDRNPRLKEGTETVVVNNVVHHYSDGMWADPDTQHSIVGNTFEQPETSQPNIFMDGGSGVPLYAEDNVQLDDADVPMIGDAFDEVDEPPLWPDGLDAMPSGDVKEANLENVGARPADRTEIDERIIEETRNGTGQYIDHPDEVEGYPDLPVNTESVDVPETGLRAWLREQALAVETN